MTDLGDKNIGDFRSSVLRLYLLIAAPASVSAAIIYYYFGVEGMTLSNAVNGAISVSLCICFLNNRVSFEIAAPIFMLSTVFTMMMGIYYGSDLVDSRPWLLFIPLGLCTLFGANTGRIWCGLILLAAVMVMQIKPGPYPIVSTAIFAFVYITMSAVAFAFCQFNEVNVRTIAKLSHTDSLTGLYNRQFFEAWSNNVFNRSLRTRESIAVYMVDIDSFKKYNDYYGHQLGDQALAQVAEVIRSSARRGSDLTFRYGGEEFCVICSGINLSDAELLGNNIIERVRNLKIPHAKSEHHVLTVSVGLSHHEELESESPESLLRYADAALYAAKSKGRNGLHTNIGRKKPDASSVIHQSA
ncbi:MAG: GGDEF domain-containing protein [Gammaproteobacteria bacterium]